MLLVGEPLGQAQDHFMAIDRETMETVTDLFWSVKITADADCSHEIKKTLAPWKKAMANPDSMFKIRDVTLLTKVHLVRDMGFPVVMYRCERWTIKKAERRKNNALNCGVGED